MTLNEKLQAAIKSAKEALAANDLEAAKTHRAEAESIKAQIEEMTALDSMEGVKYTPLRPALPNTGAGEVPQVDATAQPAAIATDATPANPLAASQKAAYVTRFGDTSDSITGVLSDLHGKNFDGVYWQQRAAFNRYLRGGEKSLRNDDEKLLRQVVMTPASIRKALEEGVDDVSALKSTMVEASDVLGGYMVPVDFQMKIIERLRGLTVVRGKASQMNTSRDRVELPEATGGGSQYSSPVRVTWVDETPTLGSAGETNLTFGLRGIPVYTAMAETPLSRNLLEDSAFDIEAYLAKKFAEAAAIDEDNLFLTGSGVGKPQGILPGRANTLSLTEKLTGSSGVVTWDGLIDMMYAIDAQYRAANSVWIMNKATVGKIRKLKDSANAYLWQPFEFFGGEAGQPPRLLGYEILEQEVMPDVATNAYPILFGDLNGYQIVDRVGMTVERYLDSQTARQNLVYFVMRRRLGGQMLETWRMAAQKVT